MSVFFNSKADEIDLSNHYEKYFNPNEEYLGLDKPVNTIEPIVSVCVITYQHADYIEKCLEGILMQKTDFPFEIIVGEDESTDGTREICKDYAEKYPDRIRLFLRDRRTSGIFNEEGKRVGGYNGKWNRRSAKGKYFAICDGDDYWTDPEKLQKQISFLEKNSNFCGICTAYSIIDSEGKIKRKKRSIKKGQSIGDNIFETTGFPKTSTVVYRNIKNETFKKLSNAPTVNGDVMLYYYMMQFGKLGYIDDVMCHYRLHSGGVHSSRNMYSKFQQTFHSLNTLKGYNLQNGVDDIIDKKINIFSNRLMAISFLKFNFEKAKYFRKKANNTLYLENLKTIMKFLLRF